jgi:uncharacterized DUF497 family protein
MAFEWDEAKRAANLDKHGIDFEFAKQIFDGPTLEAEDTRRLYDEPRFGAFGHAGEEILFVIYTWRGARRRLISARKAGRYERATYTAKLTGNDG